MGKFRYNTGLGDAMIRREMHIKKRKPTLILSRKTKSAITANKSRKALLAEAKAILSELGMLRQPAYAFVS